MQIIHTICHLGDRKITNVKSELSKLSHQYNVTLKQLNVVEETCKLYTNLFLNQTYVHSTTQNELQLLTGQYKALACKYIICLSLSLYIYVSIYI